jgi:uncharacterized protein (AIM24 family)
MDQLRESNRPEEAVDDLGHEPGRQRHADGGHHAAARAGRLRHRERVGRLNRQGAMQALFGGKGMSLATLTGNGRVILQSMTMEALGGALAKFARTGDGDNGATGVGALGGLFGGRGA